MCRTQLCFTTGGSLKCFLLWHCKSICVCSSLVSGCVWDSTTWTASVSLLTADDCETWVDQPGLPEFFLSTLAAANATARVPAPSFQCQGRRCWITFGEGGHRTVFLRAASVEDVLWLETRLTNIWQEWKDILSNLCNHLFPLLFSYTIPSFHYLQLLCHVSTSDLL